MTLTGIRAHIDAYAKKQKEAADSLQVQAWLTGYYVMHAIGVCFSKNRKYPKNPLEEVRIDNDMVLTEEEQVEWTKKMFQGFESLQKKFESNKQGGQVQ